MVNNSHFASGFLESKTLQVHGYFTNGGGTLGVQPQEGLVEGVVHDVLNTIRKPQNQQFKFQAMREYDFGGCLQGCSHLACDHADRVVPAVNHREMPQPEPLEQMHHTRERGRGLNSVRRRGHKRPHLFQGTRVLSHASMHVY